MRNLLSSLFFILIFVGLGAMAFAAAPRGEEAQNEVAAQPAAPLSKETRQENEPSAPAGNKYNFIAIPLDVASSFSSFDVNGLVDYVGAGVSEVREYDASCQGFRTWSPSSLDPSLSSGYTFDVNCNKIPTDTPWSLRSPAGGSYFLLLSGGADSTLTFVGDVPAQGNIAFTLVGAPSGCSYNSISIPLDQSAITNVDELAVDLGYTDVSEVRTYNAICQGFETWIPSSLDPSLSEGFVFNESCQKISTSDPADIPVQIGYPYLVCLESGLDGTLWPAP